MTESSFPFGAPADQEPFQDASEGERSRKPLFLVGGAVAAVVLAAGGFFLLSGGDDADLEMGVPPAAAPRAAAPSAEPAPVEVVPAAATEQIGRNPFSARYVEPVVAPAATAAPAAPGAGSIELPAIQPAQPSTGTAVGETEYPLTLVSISDPMPEARVFVFKYDDKEVTVLPAQRFGKHGELVVLAYTMEEGTGKVTGAIIQVGDASPIDIAVGETLNVL